MFLLETKETLTLFELLRIAYEYGNQNAGQPEDVPEIIDKEFSEWLDESKSLLDKLVIK